MEMEYWVIVNVPEHSGRVVEVDPSDLWGPDNEGGTTEQEFCGSHGNVLQRYRTRAEADARLAKWEECSDPRCYSHGKAVEESLGQDPGEPNQPEPCIEPESRTVAGTLLPLIALALGMALVAGGASAGPGAPRPRAQIADAGAPAERPDVCDTCDQKRSGRGRGGPGSRRPMKWCWR